MTGRPWYSFYPDAYERDAGHLSYVQDSAYRRMLDHYYKTAEPLSLDKEAIYRSCRAMRREERAAIDYCLGAFFVEGDDGYHQTRADAEIVKAAELSEKRSLAASKRYNKPPCNAPAIAEQLDTHSTATSTATVSEAKASSTKPAIAVLDDPIWGKSLIPDWIPVEAWKGYVEMRRRIRAPLTSRAVILTIGKLEALRRDGEDVGAVLDASIQNSWRGVFPVKQSGGRNVGDHKKPAQQSFASSISRAFSERNQQGEDFHGGGGAEFIPPSNPANQERTDHETPRLGGPAADAA